MGLGLGLGLGSWSGLGLGLGLPMVSIFCSVAAARAVTSAMRAGMCRLTW